MILIFNKALEVIKVLFRTKFRQATCSGR